MIFRNFFAQHSHNTVFSSKFSAVGVGLVLCFSLSACGALDKQYVPKLVKPYRFDIQQGNFITDEDVAKLKNGMSQDDVRFVLGTPLVISPFHPNRWDYVYRVQKPNNEVVQYRYTIVFENNILASHGGQDLPNTQAELLSDPSPIRNTTPKR